MVQAEVLVGNNVASLRDIHWESGLVHMVDMRKAPPMGCQMGTEMEILRDIHWEGSHLVHKQELR